MSDKLAMLSTLADQQLEAEKAVERAEADLKKAKEKLRGLSEDTIPEVMGDLQLEEFTTTSGLKIKVSEIIRASIPKQHMAAAMAWLRKHGHEKLIKTQITVVPADDKEAKDLEARLMGFDASFAPSVHPQTLGKFVKEKLENGEEVPLDLFGVFRQRVSKVKVEA